MNIATQQQHSLEWYRSRLGNITGSCVGKIYGRGRGAEFSKGGYSYLHSVAAERMLPREVVIDDDLFENYIAETSCATKAMRIGNEREAEARSLISIIYGREIKETGCVRHPEIEGFASSPDGIVLGSNPEVPEAVVEIKCPSPTVYMEYLTKVKTASDLRAYNSDYFWQCVAHIMVTGAKVCYFSVYCPFNINPLHVVPVYAKEEYFNLLEPRIKTALEYIDTIVNEAKLGLQ